MLWGRGVELAVFALVWAVLQLAVATRRDVGVVTIAALAGSVLIGSTSPVVHLGLVGISATVAAAAWSRGARRGVGRPAVTGGGLAISVLTLVGHRLLSVLAPGAPVDVFADVLMAPLVLTAVLGFALALERPGPRRVTRRWRRTIEVE
jgi:hypothetical protein